MADFIDDAQAVNELHHDVSLRNARAKSLPETHPDFDGKSCVECGDLLHSVRLAMGRVYCAPCQTEIERRQHVVDFNTAKDLDA